MELKAQDAAVITLKKGTPMWEIVKGMLGSKKGFAALTGTKVIDSEFSGDYKVLIKTVVPGSASDTLTLVRATDKVTEIVGVFPHLETGQDAALAGIFATFSGLVITLTTTASAGTAATDWTGATARLLIVARGAV